MGYSDQEFDAAHRPLRIPSRAENAALAFGPSPGLAGVLKELGAELSTLGLLEGSVVPEKLLMTPEEAKVLGW